MKLKSLHVDRMPGLERNGLHLSDLGPGLNVIVGPNGSGKTSLCRAARGLIWKDTLDDDYYYQLRSEWIGDSSERIEISRRGTEVTGLGDIDLPSPQLAGCYTITLDQVLENHNSTERSLAAEIHRQMAGGYSLKELKDELGSFSGPASFTRAQRRVAECRKELAELKSSRRRLREEELSLPKLKASVQEIAKAENELSVLEIQLECFKLQEKLLAVQAELSAFPALLEKVKGNEASLWEDLEKQLQQAREAESVALSNVERTRAKLVSFPDFDLAQVNQQLDQLTDLEATIRDLEASMNRIELELCEIEVSAAATEQFLCQFTENGQSPSSALFVPELFERAENLISRFSELAARESLLLAQKKALTHGGESYPPSDELSLLSNLVRRLLQSERAHKRHGLRDALNVLFVVGTSILLYLLATLHSPLWFYGLFVPWFLWLGALFAGRSSSLRSEWNEILERLQASGVRFDAPFEPQLQDLEALLSELERLTPLAKKDELRKIDLQRTTHELSELSTLLDSLHTDYSAVSNHLGLRAGLSSLALYHLASRFRELHANHTELVAKRSSLEHLKQKRREVLATAQRLVKTLKDSELVSLSQVVAELKFHRKQLMGFKDLKTEERSNITELEHSSKRVRQVREAQTKILLALGLAESDQEGLLKLLEFFAEYDHKRREKDAICVQLKALQLKLEGLQAPETTSSAAELTIRRTELLDMIAHKETIAATIGGITRAVNDARASREIEEAISALDEAEAKLKDLTDRKFTETCMSVLLDAVQSDNEQANRPAVALEADRLFRLFTKGAYELHTSPSLDSPAFQAKDVVAGEMRELSELSLGTRTQLLLAARLAFVLHAESGQHLPLFLDEILSSSDPIRFEAISACLLALVKEGRQVFYLSCQPEDAHRLKQVATDSGVSEIKIIQLEKIPARYTATADSIRKMVQLDAHQYPKPGPESYEEYVCKLSVPPLSPNKGSHAVHLAYLLDDADSLYSLLSQGFRTLGELRALTEADPVSRFLSPDQWNRVMAKAKIIDAFSSAWSVGRGKPLSPEVIQKAIQSKYTDQIISAAEELDWSVRALMERIDPDGARAIKGFRKSKYQDFVEALTESGHYSETEPFTEAQARSFVLSRVRGDIERRCLKDSEFASLFDVLWKAAQEPERADV